MRTDNNEHKALFTIPTAAHSSALANIKRLPEQRRITGHKQTDAYLWVLEVIRLNEPAHLDAAEAALEKIEILLPQRGRGTLRALLLAWWRSFRGCFRYHPGMDNPAQAIGNARTSKKHGIGQTAFGYEAALASVTSTRLIISTIISRTI